MYCTLLSAFIILLLSQCTNQKQKAQNVCFELDSLMYIQQKAWNTGDIKTFMKSYWKNDSLQFIGSNGITKGWQATLDRYKTSYPDKDTMGKLKITNMECLLIDNTHYHIVGNWILYRRNDTLQGFYSLLWKNINGEWVIIKDHSS